MIASKDLSSLEMEEKRLYERKREGHEYFVNAQYFKAYQVFRDLQDRYPQDPDVISFLEKSEEQLRRETFFLDEAEQIDTLPGATELLFVNDRDEDEREVVFIGKLAGIDAGVFAKDIEVLRFDERGLVVHFYAPYGKFHDGMLNLHGVDKVTADREAVPRYLAGAARLREQPLPYMFSLRPPLGQLPSLGGGRGASVSAGTQPARPDKHYFINRTERLRLISRVIFRCIYAGMPVTRRGRILPLSVTNFFSRSGFL